MAESGSSEKLYTPRLLSLAAQLAAYPFTGPFDAEAEGRSRTCGSTISIGVDLDDDCRIIRTGMIVTACAIGQSSAAIMAGAAEGHGAQRMSDMLAVIEAWLGSGGALPDWRGFDALEPALPHKGRHGAILLPWKAMRDALSSQPSCG